MQQEYQGKRTTTGGKDLNDSTQRAGKLKKRCKAMATTTKKQQPATKKAATKKPAVKKRKPVKKPVSAVKLEKLSSKKLKQQAFLNAYTASGGFNISESCRASGVARSNIDTWVDNDPAFAAKMRDAHESKLDAWEAALHTRAIADSDACLIFALKTKGKERGYVERENNNRQTVKIIEKVQAGDMTVIDAGYEFAKLGLPMPEVIKLQLSRIQIDVNVDEEFSGLSTEEMERRAQERFDAVQKQRDEFLPERRAEVAEIKERLKDQDSFAPEKFEEVE
jgi:hypothetical protein